MNQTRLMSLAEAAANVVLGFGLAVVTQIVVFPLFGFAPSLSQNLRIGLVFTLVSLARGYVLRRLFDRFCRERS
jgi:di/tricarboxylate transporter